MPRAGSSISLQASKDFHGNSALRSTSAAWGATFSSQKVRRVCAELPLDVGQGEGRGAHRPILAERAERPFILRQSRRQCADEVAEQQLGELHRRHLGDPVRHVLEDLEGVGPVHVLGGLLGRRPPERLVAGGPDVERRDRHRLQAGEGARRPWPGTS